MRSRSASSNGSSPRMARSVMAAIFGPMPASRGDFVEAFLLDDG